MTILSCTQFNAKRTMMVPYDAASTCSSDDGSVCSTETNTCNLPRLDNKGADIRGLRRVRFNDLANVTYQIKTSSEKARELWYQTSDYQRFKSESKNVLTNFSGSTLAEDEVAARLAQFVDVMGRFFRSCFSYQNNFPVQGDEEAMPCLTRVQVEMIRNNHLSFHFLGLTGVVVKRIQSDKKQRRQELLDTVLELQEAYLSDAERNELIASAAQRISQPSRRFASLLGQTWALH